MAGTIKEQPLNELDCHVNQTTLHKRGALHPSEVEMIILLVPGLAFAGVRHLAICKYRGWNL